MLAKQRQQAVCEYIYIFSLKHEPANDQRSFTGSIFVTGKCGNKVVFLHFVQALCGECIVCWVFDSAPSLGVYYFLSLTLSVCMSVCLSVTLLLQITSSFLFLDGIEPFFARQFYMWHSTKLFS